MTSDSTEHSGKHQPSDGHWESLNRSWWDPKVINCEMCGQMIPRDLWMSADGHSFCSIECDALYRSYWLPRYGPDKDRPTGS